MGLKKVISAHTYTRKRTGYSPIVKFFDEILSYLFKCQRKHSTDFRILNWICNVASLSTNWFGYKYLYVIIYRTQVCLVLVITLITFNFRFGVFMIRSSCIVQHTVFHLVGMIYWSNLTWKYLIFGQLLEIVRSSHAQQQSDIEFRIFAAQ